MALEKIIVLEGRSWGCQAQKDCDKGRFFYPLRITKVHRNSEAEGAGLRVGDVIAGWTLARESGFTNVRADTCFSSLRQFVDEATQQMMEAGGPCHMRCRLVLRCSTHQCTGTIVRETDCLDDALVCNGCGLVVNSSLFTALDEFEASTRCAVSSADAFVVQQGALARPGQFTATASARQETMLAGGGAQGKALARAKRVGAGKDNADARREERMQKQQAKAREDIIRYCDALHLPNVAREEALQLFAVAANTSNTCLKSGSVIDNYFSTVLASIHCASLKVDCLRTLHAVLAVADVGAGATLQSVSVWVKKIRKAYHHPIPTMVPAMVIRDMCGRLLQLPVSYEEQALAVLPLVKTACGSAGPQTVAAVAVVVVASRTTGACDMRMCKRASEASGITQETSLPYVRKALGL